MEIGVLGGVEVGLFKTAIDRAEKVISRNVSLAHCGEVIRERVLQ